MSGGVDSSTVAAMLRAEGHNLIGLTMQLWNQRRLAGHEGMPEQFTDAAAPSTTSTTPVASPSRSASPITSSITRIASSVTWFVHLSRNTFPDELQSLAAFAIIT